MELLFVGSEDCGDLFAYGLYVLGHDDCKLAWLTHQPATVLVAPLAGGVENREAIRKARRDFMGEET